MTVRTFAVPLGSVSVDGALCTACGACLAVCPYELLGIPDGPGPVVLLDPESCTSCSACASVCPVRAIAVRIGA